MIDTSVLVRALIKPGGTVGPILSCMRDGEYVPIYTKQILEEYIATLTRPRIRDKYNLTADVVEAVMNLFAHRGRLVEPARRIQICRDPNDDMFLEAALEGAAAFIVSGDEDLLVLEQYEGVRIVAPREFFVELSHDQRSSGDEGGVAQE